MKTNDRISQRPVENKGSMAHHELLTMLRARLADVTMKHKELVRLYVSGDNVVAHAGRELLNMYIGEAAAFLSEHFCSLYYKTKTEFVNDKVAVVSFSITIVMPNKTKLTFSSVGEALWSAYPDKAVRVAETIAANRTFMILGGKYLVGIMKYIAEQKKKEMAQVPQQASQEPIEQPQEHNITQEQNIPEDNIKKVYTKRFIQLRDQKGIDKVTYYNMLEQIKNTVCPNPRTAEDYELIYQRISQLLEEHAEDQVNIQETELEV